MRRLWNLRLNLDELNALNLVGMSEQIRSDLWTGLIFGCNGMELPEGVSKYLQSGFELGSAWRAEAEDHVERMASGGRASAQSRKAKHGTAQPSKVVRSTIEAPSEGSLNQSTIYNLESNTTNKPTKPRKAKKDTTQIPAEFLEALTGLCKNWPSFNTGSDGEKSDLRKWTDPVDLWEAMVKNFPNDDKKLMINCGLVHLTNIKPKREFDKPGFAYAMCNFYGPKQAHWKKLKGAVEEATAESE